jgi:hypothetical protein
MAVGGGTARMRLRRGDSRARHLRTEFHNTIVSEFGEAV